MTTLVLTVIGDDRSGLVSSLSDAIHAHNGNWTTSQMAQLAGKFAGIVLVEVPDENAEDLKAALEPLAGLLDITVQEGSAPHALASRRLEIDFVGDDHPGIVRQITDVINKAGGSIELLSSDVIEAPMAGGMLFTAHAVVLLGADNGNELREQLEALQNDLMVEFTFGA